MKSSIIHNRSFFLLIFFSLIVGLFTLLVWSRIFPLMSLQAFSFCQKVSSARLSLISPLLPSFILLMWGVAFPFGISSFLLQLWRTRSLLKRLLLGRMAIPPRLQRVITRLNLDGKVYYVKGKTMFSFCSGILSQKIVLSSTFVSSLGVKELEAVLLHEKAHLLGRDPLKILIGKTVATMFFFLPIFFELYKNMVVANEMRADRFAIEFQQQDYFLKRVLRKVLSTANPSQVSLPALAQIEYLELRIYKLANPALIHTLKVSVKSIVVSFFFLAMGWFVLQTPTSAFFREEREEHLSLLCVVNRECWQECHRDNQFLRDSMLK